MPSLSDIATSIQDKLEEPRGTEGIFWDRQQELYPAIVEGMNEAALITGDPELRVIGFNIEPGGVAAQNPAQYSGYPPFIYAIPPTSILMVRMDAIGSGPIKKVFACDLDRNNPGWEGQVGQIIKRWFPVGMTLFGVWPAPSALQTVNLTVLSFPITTTTSTPATSRYTGAELSPFREEYTDGFAEYGAHIARLKEGGADFQQSIPQYQSYQDKMMSLTKFAARRGISRFTKVGRETKVNDVMVK